MSALLLVVLGCGEPEPTRFEECARLDPLPREDCRLGFARQLLDRPDELQAALDSLPDDSSRDLLLLRLAVAEPTRASGLCGRTRSEPAREKCRQVLGRPHLSTPAQAPR